MALTLSGTSISKMPVPLKADTPMAVTVAGSTTAFTSLWSQKALSANAVTVYSVPLYSTVEGMTSVSG